MASSRSSSPASEGGSPEPLTPRSKIRALLATVESSDEENGSKSGPSSKEAKRLALTQGLFGARQPARDDEDDDDSDVDIRPRGRLAARMHGDGGPAVVPEPDTADSARERLKKMLQREEEEDERPEEQAAPADDDEQDALPSPPRRLKRRAPREPTPDDTAEVVRPPSPGLFVSSPMRPSPTKSADHHPDSETELPSYRSDRFKALVERKRQERLAREAAEEARRAERQARQEKLASELDELDPDDGNVSSITDDEGGRRLTQDARPMRKASKRAIEEMNRETQRMARSMQLAQQIKTKKKLSKSSMFERFNFRPAGEPEPVAPSSSRPASPHTDAEMRDADTPPSSPPLEKHQEREEPIETAQVNAGNPAADDGLPSMDDMMATAPQRTDKGKGKAVDVEILNVPAQKPKRQIRVKLPPISANLVTIDSDDELKITDTTKAKVNAIFDRAPFEKNHESHSLKALRALAQVRSPGKAAGRKAEHVSMTSAELETYLHQKARQQAKLERDRRLDMLKAQGITVQTAEERERQEQEVEDILARAREEAQKIMQEERAAAKEERRESGEVDPLAWDDSEDEEYEDPANEADEEVSDIELSGSEDEEQGEDGDDGEIEEVAGNALFEVEAEDSDEEESEEILEATHDDQLADEEEDDPPTTTRRAARNHAAVLSDDEAEVGATPKPKTKVQMSPAIPSTVSPAAPGSVLRSAKKTFIPGLPVEGPAGLSLTQIFAGTMDDSQMPTASGPTQSMMPFDSFPDSFPSASASQPVEDMVMDDQEDDTQGVQLNLSQSQMHGLDSLLRDVPDTQISEMIEMSQDGGFQEHTPLRQRFIEPPFSTVDTVQAEQQEDVQDSPLVRRGRLRRKGEMQMAEAEVPGTAEQDEVAETAFDAIKTGASEEKRRQLVEEFNRKKSKAKEMVQEQAEESEDEYAGLGGADGEDSDNESLASVGEMIDDGAGNDFDERKLAAFYADRERAKDEKEVEKLFKDITSGMLRRKRGADYDLSDSDDGGEARRRMKRRQFAKMQKALFADDRVKKMAEDPGNLAFLRTMEDQRSDDEMDFGDAAEEVVLSDEEDPKSQAADGAAAQQQRTIPDSQPGRALGPAGGNVRPPANARRTRDGKKPSNIGEVRETLSSLLEETEESFVIPATEIGSDSDADDEDELARLSPPPASDKENQAPNPRRGRDAAAVVDRISLKRNSSSTLSTSTTASASRPAFATAAAASIFKVPALLRRATTNSLMSVSSTGSSSSSSNGAAATPGFGEDAAKIKKAAGRGSGVVSSGFSRAGEATAARTKIQESERRRRERRAKGAERRMGVVGGLLGRGSFE